MQGNDDTLQQALINSQPSSSAVNDAAAHPTLVIEPHGSYIIFSYSEKHAPGSPANAVPPSLVARCFYYSALSFVMITKCVASSGMMVFAERDLLENEHYVFWKIIFRHFPEFAVTSIVVCTVFSDAFMNLVTRGAATAKMLRALLYGQRTAEGESVLSGSCVMRLSKMMVMFCGGLSSVTASLVAFLGAVTLGHYVTDDLYILMAWGSMVAFANFIANISYRIDKSVDNLVKLVRGELKFTLWHLLISAIGSAAFLGQCYYGTSNAIRKLLDLLKIYAGEPESGLGVIVSYENWINGATDATLPFAIVSYFFSSCVPMFMPEQLTRGEGYLQVPLKQVILFSKKLKKTEYYQKQRFFDRDYWYLEGLQLFCSTLMPFFVVSVMVGSILPTFNSSNGLIIHVLFNSKQDFSELEKLLIAVLSLILTVVFSKIFWSFNVVDWFKQVEEVWVREEMRVLARAGLHDPLAGIEGLKQEIQLAVDEQGSTSGRQGQFGRLWPRFTAEVSPSVYARMQSPDEAPMTPRAITRALPPA